MKPRTFISLGKMEGICQKILVDSGLDPYHKAVRPIPIEEIIEFHFDLRLDWEPIDHLDKDGLVMAAILPLEKRIILNESQRELFDQHVGTLHFTLAHELGHWILHTSESAHQPFYCRSTSTKPAEEIQADLFAGCLLMPRPMMERATNQLRMKGRIHLHHLYMLADCLQVSISALTIRLKQLRILNIERDGTVSRPGYKETVEQLALQI